MGSKAVTGSFSKEPSSPVPPPMRSLNPPPLPREIQPSTELTKPESLTGTWRCLGPRDNRTVSPATPPLSTHTHLPGDSGSMWEIPSPTLHDFYSLYRCPGSKEYFSLPI